MQKQSNQQYFLEVDIQYLQSLHSQHSDLPILPERIKIEKLEKLIGNLHDKTEYVIHIKSLKQTLNHELNWKKVNRFITFNKKSRLKPNIGRKIELRIKQKMTLRKTLNWWTIQFLEKNYWKERDNQKERDIKLVTESRTNYLVSKPISNLKYLWIYLFI